MKKEWSKPELKIIVRATSEESVLGACKNLYSGLALGGPESHYGKCMQGDEYFEYCHEAVTS